MIGPMEVKNRIVMSAMDPGFGIDDNGCVTEQLTEFLVERARSRPGMIITGATPVHPTGTADPKTIKMVPIWEGRVLPSLERMVRAVHEYDVKFGAQLNHGGLAHLPQESVCASVIPELAQFGLPLREASGDELKVCHCLRHRSRTMLNSRVRLHRDSWRTWLPHKYLPHPLLQP
jgi:2,4-dienoyl-CoA reductase-like NADH-dependent reductase (Old Yellow Enzyme family)